MRSHEGSYEGIGGRSLFYRFRVPVQPFDYTQVSSGLSRLQLPLLLLHGGEDRTIAPQASERIFNGASSADKTLKIFPGLRHEILNEPERQQVLVMILDWLRRHLG